MQNCVGVLLFLGLFVTKQLLSSARLIFQLTRAGLNSFTHAMMMFQTSMLVFLAYIQVYVGIICNDMKVNS